MSYEFLRPLGQGAFGEVWLARKRGREDFSKMVAIKTMRADIALDREERREEVLLRALDEALLLGHLQHPNIVQVFDVVRFEGRPAVVMEYLEGVNLQELMHYLRQQKMDCPVRAAFELIGRLAEALDFAWRARSEAGTRLELIHRDIKPSNIMITRHQVKLLDFGTARANFETRKAETKSARFGTQAYMSPERQLWEGDLPAGDIYSLGLVLFELLTGTTNRERPDAFSSRREFLDNGLSQLRLGGALTGPVEDIHALLTAMLHVDPLERPDAARVADSMEMFAQRATDDGLRAFRAGAVSDAITAHCAWLETQVVGEISLGSTQWEADAGLPSAPLTAPTTHWEAQLAGDQPGDPASAPTTAAGPPSKPPTGSRTAILVAVMLIVAVGALAGLNALRSGPGVVPAPVAEASPIASEGGAEENGGSGDEEPPQEGEVVGADQGPGDESRPAPVQPGPIEPGPIEPPPVASGPGGGGESGVGSGEGSGEGSDDTNDDTNDEEPPALGLFRAETDEGTAAWLVDEAGVIHLGGEVPAGGYVVMSRFEDGMDVLPVGEATVEANKELVVRCSRRFGKCSIER